jgi:hypothetical protein
LLFGVSEVGDIASHGVQAAFISTAIQDNQRYWTWPHVPQGESPPPVEHMLIA